MDIILVSTHMETHIVCRWVLVWRVHVQQGLVRGVLQREDVVGRVDVGWVVVV